MPDVKSLYQLVNITDTTTTPFWTSTEFENFTEKQETHEPTKSKPEVTVKKQVTVNNVTSVSKKNVKLRTKKGTLTGTHKQVIPNTLHPNEKDYINILNKYINPEDLMKVVSILCKSLI